MGARGDATVAAEIGRVLRSARRSRGLTLQQVGNRSHGAFKPTAVASYERGDRNISLWRFVQLMKLYEIPPARPLAEIDEAIDARS